MGEKKIKKIVKDHYKKIAAGKNCCTNCTKNEFIPSHISKSIGYSDEDVHAIPEANLGLGCGNPIAYADLKEGDIVLDLGSGAGFDCFLAAKKVGKSGKVIGVDMTEEMIDRSHEIAKKYGYFNVEFYLGDINKLPFEDNSVDIIISNCVVNLAPDKLTVFTEAYRVLKRDGKMYLSDIVLLKELTPMQRNDKDLIAGCVGGALLKDDYLKLINEAGFRVKILSEDKDISKKQYNGISLESLKIMAYK